jgi:hypothetical protein
LLAYQIAADATGVAEVRVVLRDNGGTENGGTDATTPFVLSIRSTPKPLGPPSFVPGGALEISEDAMSQTVKEWATRILVGEPVPTEPLLTFGVSTDTPGLFSAAPTISADGTLRFTPAPDANGLARVTVILRDNGGTANGRVDISQASEFTIRVEAVNDAPSFVAGAAPLVVADGVARTYSGWASEVRSGPADESAQTLRFEVSTTQADLFLAVPVVGSNGDLSLRPAPGAGGTATLSIVLVDDGGTHGGGIDRSAPQTVQLTIGEVESAIRVRLESTPMGWRLLWNSRPGLKYQVQRCSVLGDPWNKVGQTVVSTREESELEDSETAQSTRFYRVVKVAD